MESLGQTLRAAKIKQFSIRVPECDGEAWGCHARRDAGFAYGLPADSLETAVQNAIEAFVKSNQYSLSLKPASFEKPIDDDLADLLG